jgi:hypothetical protein
MIMKNFIFSSISLVMCIFTAQAQDCTYYFPVKQETTLEMKTYDAKKMIFTIRSKGIEWISQKAGLVKSEAYSEKGKLQSYTLLTSLKE